MACPATVRILPAIVLALCLAACAAPARQVTPIAMSQPGDEQLTCAHLNGQIDANAAAATGLLRKDEQVKTGNVVKLVFGIVGTSMMDWSDEEKVKARSMIDRNERLTELHRAKGCSEP